MAPAPKPTKGGLSEAAAEVIVDLSTEGVEASAVTVTAATKGGIGTAAYSVLTAARDGLIAAGQNPPKGLTLRADHGELVTAEDGSVSRTVTFYYGDPTTGKYPTDPKYIGK